MLKDALVVFNALYVIKELRNVGNMLLNDNLVCYHFNINNLNDKERQEFLGNKKQFFLEKLKGRLERKEISASKLVFKLKMEISNLKSLEIVRKEG